jgi:hypothetical protein
MTYFSDFETTEYCYDDEQLRKTILRAAEKQNPKPSYETVPQDWLADLLTGYDE